MLSVSCFLLVNCIGADKGDLRKPGINPVPPASVQQEPAPTGNREPALKGNIARAVPAPAPRPKAKPIGFSIDPESLLNLPESDLVAKMGLPTVRREEPPAVIWSYVRGECRLDIYLYESLNTEILRSLTYTMASTRKDVAPKTYCLAKSN